MSDALNGTRPRAERPDPILAALLQLAQPRAVEPLGQAFQRGMPAPSPREPGPRGRQMAPSWMLDVEPFGELLQLYDLFAPRKGRVGAPGPDAPPFLFEHYSPGEEELLRLFERLRQLPPIPVRPERG